MLLLYFIIYLLVLVAWLFGYCFLAYLLIFISCQIKGINKQLLLFCVYVYVFVFGDNSRNAGMVVPCLY